MDRGLRSATTEGGLAGAAAGTLSLPVGRRVGTAPLGNHLALPAKAELNLEVGGPVGPLRPRLKCPQP